MGPSFCICSAQLQDLKLKGNRKNNLTLWMTSRLLTKHAIFYTKRLKGSVISWLWHPVRDTGSAQDKQNCFISDFKKWHQGKNQDKACVHVYACIPVWSTSFWDNLFKTKQKPNKTKQYGKKEPQKLSSNNWILMSCQPHRVTSGQSNSDHKQIHTSKLLFSCI